MTTPTYRWECVTDKAAFAPRDGAGALVFENRMWLLGGWNPRDMTYFPRTCNNEVWSSTDGRDWTLVKPNTFHNTGRTFNRLSDWAGRHTAGYAVYKGRMWVMEGSAEGKNTNEVWHSADGVTWTELPGTPWKPRHAASVFVYDSALWMVAGNNMESDVWKLSRSPAAGAA